MSDQRQRLRPIVARVQRPDERGEVVIHGIGDIRLGGACETESVRHQAMMALREIAKLSLPVP